MVTYEVAYREAYREIMDFLMSVAEQMYDNDPPESGDVDKAADDALRDVWKAIHGIDSAAQDERDDPYWDQIVRDVARSAVKSI